MKLDIQERGRRLKQNLETIINSPSPWLHRIGKGVTPEGLSGFSDYPNFLGVDDDQHIANMVTHNIVDRILIEHGKTDFNKAKIRIYGIDRSISPKTTFSLAYIGQVTGRINILGKRSLDRDAIIHALTKKYPHIKIVTDEEIHRIADYVDVVRGNLGAYLTEDGPLKVLIATDQEDYCKATSKCFNSKNYPGRYLFDTKCVSTSALTTSLRSNGTPVPDQYPADILLLDIKPGYHLLDDNCLPLLNKYLAKHQNTYTIVTLTEGLWLDLADNSQWQTLQRSVTESPIFHLTHSERQPTAKKGVGIETFWKMLFHKYFYDEALTTLCDLRHGNKGVRRNIARLPTQFDAFRDRIHSEFGKSELVQSALQTMSTFDPDDTLKMLAELQPWGPQSTPQHCYPDFDKTIGISSKVVADHLTEKPIENPSVYFHMAFCPDKCQYCDYPTVGGANKETLQRYLTLLQREIETFHKLTGWDTMSPIGIQIGGGTPTYYSAAAIRQFGKILRKYLNIQDTTQITFEASPSTTSDKKLDAFFELGAQRASIGLQAPADEAQMHWAKRVYTKRIGLKAINALLKRWPKTTNADLMYGLPGQNPFSLERDLEAAIEWGIPSLTFYNLRISPRTGYHPNQEFPSIYSKAILYLMAWKKMHDSGYSQTADNQFVKSVSEQPYVYRDSKKRGGTAVGFGMGAYSIHPGDADNTGLIYWNKGGKEPLCQRENLDRYSADVGAGRIPSEIGLLMDTEDQMRQFIIQGLKLSAMEKTQSGVDTAEFEKRFGMSIQDAFPHTKKLQDHQLLWHQNGYLGLSFKGLVFEEPVLKTYFP